MSLSPAGSQTRCCTRSWNGTPLARSAINASTTNPPLQYENAVPGANFAGWPSRTTRYCSVVANSCTGTGIR